MRLHPVLLGVVLVIGATASPSAETTDSELPAWCVHDKDFSKQLKASISGLIQKKATLDSTLFHQQLDKKTCGLSLPPAPTREMSGEQLYEACRDGVLVVGKQFQCDRCSRTHVSTASGFVITESGAFVTSYHVVDDPKMDGMVVMTRTGQTYGIKEVLAADKMNDFAILQLDGTGFQPLPLSREAPVGSIVYVISHPDQNHYVMTQGMVSRYALVDRKNTASVKLMSITADFAKGSSGAPILNSRGAVVGIVRQTESIYYSEENHVKTDLQMVIKECTPVSFIRETIR